MKTDSTPVEAPKDPDASDLFQIFRQFSTPAEQADLRQRMLAGGMGWGTLKDILFEQLDGALAGPRERYRELVADPTQMEEILADGAERARDRARQTLTAVRAAIGIAEQPT